MGATRKRKRKQPLDPGDPPYLYEHQHARMELDSHADTCALGNCCVVLQDTGRTVTVEGFDDGIGALDDVHIVTAAVAHDCPTTSETWLQVFHEALHIPEMETHLVNPFQVRNQGLIVNDTPLSQLSAEERTKEAHSIIDEDSGLHVPMDLNGTMSGWTVRKPTMEEIQGTADVNVVHMTSNQRWKPHRKSFAEVEQSLRDDIDRGIDLHLRESREIGRIQARGQYMWKSWCC